MKYTIVEPHFDDAWINLGGYVLMHPEIEFAFVTVSDYPTNNKDGTAKLARFLPNVTGTFLGYASLGFDDEHMYKMRADHPGKSDSEIFLAINGLSDMVEVSSRIADSCRGSSKVFWPMGLKHPQHILMRAMLPSSGYLQYREYPYFFYPDQTAYKKDLIRGKRRTDVDISEVLDRKLDLFGRCYVEQAFLATLDIGGTTLPGLSHESYWDDIRD